MRQRVARHHAADSRTASLAPFDFVQGFLCGFTHITPIPTASELEEVYRTELYGKEKPDYLERHRQVLVLLLA